MKESTKMNELRDLMKEEILMEALMDKRFITDESSSIKKRLDNYLKQFKILCPGSGYRRYGKYMVKETFAGNQTLTELLKEYVEKTASLKY